MFDLLTAVVSGAVGVAAGGVVVYFVFYSRPKPKEVVVAAREPGGRAVVTTVSSAELEKSKREMRTVMVERDLLSSALMKLYEAESEGKITREEREMISKRYSEQIKGLQTRLEDVELVVEVAELEGLRNELMTLFEQKVSNIEARLDAAKQKLGVVAQPEPEAPKGAAEPKRDRVTDLEKAVEKRAKPELSESEKRIKQLRDEVMDAVSQLEQIDLEKKQQEN